MRRRIAFEHQGRVPLAGDLLDGRHQLQPVGRGARSLRVAGLDGKRIERRQEDVQPAVSRLDHRRGTHDPRVGRQLLRGRPGQARHRQPQAGRRVAGDQRHPAAQQRPIAGPPAPLAPQDRQHEGHRCLRVDRRPVERARRGHLVRRDHELRIEAQPPGETPGEVSGRGCLLGPLDQPGPGDCRPITSLAPAGDRRIVGQERAPAPERPAVAPPHEVERPARQRLAGVPLSLAFQEQAAGSQPVEQPAGEHAGPPPLVGTEGRRVPFRRVAVVERHEGRLAAHGQPHVAGGERRVHLVADRQDSLPLRLREGPGRSRTFRQPGEPHLEGELGPTGIDRPGHRRGAGRVGRGRQRDVTLGGQQAARGIEAHPAGAGQVDLGPGVQVGEVGGRSGRSVERPLIRHELHEVPRAEPGRQAQPPGERHEQPGRIPAAARAQGERLLGRLHARLHPDHVGHAIVDSLIEGDEQVDRPPAGRGRAVPAKLGEKGLDSRATGRRGRAEGGGQFGRQQRIVGERKPLRLGLEEEVEGVDRHQFGDQIDLQHEPPRGLGKHDSRDVVALRILLPVEEVAGRFDAERVAGHPRAAVGRRPEPDRVRGQPHLPVEAVFGAMVEGDPDGHLTPSPPPGAPGAGSRRRSRESRRRPG